MGSSAASAARREPEGHGQPAGRAMAVPRSSVTATTRSTMATTKWLAWHVTGSEVRRSHRVVGVASVSASPSVGCELVQSRGAVLAEPRHRYAPGSTTHRTT